MPVAANDLNTHKGSIIVSWILAAVVTLRYLAGRLPQNKNDPYHVADNPFTANIIVIMVYWSLMFLLQIAFVIQLFIPLRETGNGSENRLEISKKIGWHFTFFNLLVFLWTLLFVSGHYFWSDVFVVVNFLNILQLHRVHKTHKLESLPLLVFIHWPITAFPLSWLFYAIFMNTSVLFHVHKFVGRIISNVLIWAFLVVPGFALVVLNDWSIALTSSILTFGIGLGQLFTKAFALQWIFAFIISGLLFAGAVAAFVTSVFKTDRTLDERAPLLEDN